MTKCSREFVAENLLRALDYVGCYCPILDRMGSIQGKSVLDFGCGTGNFTRMLANRGAQVVGVDKCAEKIAQARSFESEVEYRVVPENNLQLRDTFDAIVSTYVYCVFPNRNSLEEVTGRLASCLKEGADLFIGTPHPDSVNQQNDAWLREGPRDVVSGDEVRSTCLLQDGLTYTDYWHCQADYVAAVRNAGLDLQEIARVRPSLCGARGPDVLLLHGKKLPLEQVVDFDG